MFSIKITMPQDDGSDESLMPDNISKKTKFIICLSKNLNSIIFAIDL